MMTSYLEYKDGGYNLMIAWDLYKPTHQYPFKHPFLKESYPSECYCIHCEKVLDTWKVWTNYEKLSKDDAIAVGHDYLPVKCYICGAGPQDIKIKRI